MQIIKFILLFGLLTLVISERFQVFFDYNKQYQWPTLCNTGTRQSPIDIQLSKAQICPNDITYKVTQDADGADIVVHHIENTKDLQNPFQYQTFIKLIQNATQANFYSLEFHWHTPSQHKLDGKQFDLELHIIHRSLGSDGRVAVTGLLFNQVSDNTSTIFDKLNFVQGDRQKYEFPFDLDGKFVYHYKGSLTTPPCSEIVDWFVYLDPIAINKFQLDMIKGAKNNGKPNSRRVQKLNDRAIYFLAGECQNRASLILGN